MDFPQAITGLDDLMGQLMDQRHLMVRNNGHPEVAKGQQTFGSLGSGRWSFSDFLYHEQYILNSSRPRSAQGTIELRSACQQPASAHMAATAFGPAWSNHMN